jgi:thiol:disulfide interchange protein DsbA
VPTLAVDGKYFTSASIAGSHEAALKVADQLIVRARGEQGRK